ncbi:GNAT family N-acetyltransferase [Pelagibaculum spongiae]|uniref:N-acetyltransferase domain-containing protein n=1 Tax=Pelagibaculum spongiae TaxID=2080658 RepID=A0A2V1GVC1_9GAMM|nr:GNAT family N-acetyltransferase [Pelagibaculum spongiae]PVZ67617.1 hypothetical protein DC094_14350 [Pelagibaculum spongiae]
MKTLAINGSTIESLKTRGLSLKSFPGHYEIIKLLCEPKLYNERKSRNETTIDFLKDDPSTYFCHKLITINLGDNILGYLELNFENDRELHLETVQVADNSLRKGYGNLLILLLIIIGRLNPFSKISLTDVSEIEGLYEKYGFILINPKSSRYELDLRSGITGDLLKRLAKVQLQPFDNKIIKHISDFDPSL